MAVTDFLQSATVYMYNNMHFYKIVTGSEKTQHNRAFFKFLFINLFSQVYPLAKFQPHMSITLGVTALQSSNNRNIDLYSKYREINCRCLQKMVVTYQHVEVRS